MNLDYPLVLRHHGDARRVPTAAIAANRLIAMAVGIIISAALLDPLAAASSAAGSARSSSGRRSTPSSRPIDVLRIDPLRDGAGAVGNLREGRRRAGDPVAWSVTVTATRPPSRATSTARDPVCRGASSRSSQTNPSRRPRPTAAGRARPPGSRRGPTSCLRATRPVASRSRTQACAAGAAPRRRGAPAPSPCR